MWIKNISINSCRLLNSVSLELSPDINILIGPNASGKTSFLEALNILSKGRSFRTSHIDEVISKEKDSILVAANITNENNELSHVGINKTKQKTKIRINKKDIYSQAELSLHLPVTVIHPNSIDLITGSPSIRRSFLDWIAFYKFPEFHKLWKNYQHILKQRNICLKFNEHRYALDKWTEELVELQPILISYREKVIEILQANLNITANHLLKGIDISLHLSNGFPKDTIISTDHLLEFYKSKKQYDLKIKRTSSGCHKSDFKIHFNNISANECGSRGQLKLLAICLQLSQSNCISNNNIGEGILLLDDLGAELDTFNKNNLINYLSTLNKQLIITSTHDLEFKHENSKVFHVKHGMISE